MNIFLLATALASLTSSLTQFQGQTTPNGENSILQPETQTSVISPVLVQSPRIWQRGAIGEGITQEIPLSFTYKNITITETNVWEIMDSIISCESQGIRGAYNPKDVDNLPAFGEGQFKKTTWEEWEKESGIVGDPMVRADTLKMMRWALLRGKGTEWGCFNTAVKNYLK